MIGIFDSGIGGLSVLKEIHKQLPEHELIYIADSAYIPYGEKSVQQIIERVVLITQTLISEGAEIIVVACNTATALAVDHLREKFSLPIVAMEPAVKPGVRKSRNKNVGILATTMTLSSRRYMNLLERFAVDAQVIEQPCPGLVEQVEAMDLESETLNYLLHKYIDPLVEKDIDTIVLGCTHYPFLKDQISGIIGDEIKLIDTAKAVTEELKRKIKNFQRVQNKTLGNRFYTTGDLMLFQKQLDYYWPEKLTAEKLEIS